jgi:short-subunit dehydrogenase
LEDCKYLKLKFKKVEFRFLSIDLSKENSFKEVVKHTNDIEVGLLFNNVGYLNCNVSNSEIMKLDI